MNSIDKNIWLFGLLVSCPMDEPENNCPLNSLRQNESSEKFKFAFMCPTQKIDEILVYHQNCLQIREKSIA